MARSSPALMRRRLAQLLSELRDADGRSALAVTSELGWSLTKLTRLEAGQMSLPKPAEISALLKLYGVAAEKYDEIMDLVDKSRHRGWWQGGRAWMSDTYRHYIGLEAAALQLHNWEPTIIPGLFQTREYARAMIESRGRVRDADRIEEFIEVRMRRQALLSSDPPLHVAAIIDEIALRRMPLTGRAAAEQLEHLAKVSQWDNVKLQVLPETAPIAPPGSSFVVLQFHEPDAPAMVYCEHASGATYVEDAAATNDFIEIFQRLLQVSLSFKQSTDMITEIAVDLREGRTRERTRGPGPEDEHPLQ